MEGRGNQLYEKGLSYLRKKEDLNARHYLTLALNYSGMELVCGLLFHCLPVES